MDTINQMGSTVISFGLAESSVGLVEEVANNIPADGEAVSGGDAYIFPTLFRPAAILARSLVATSLTACSGGSTIGVGAGFMIIAGGVVIHYRTAYQELKPKILRALRERPKYGEELKKELNAGQVIYSTLRQMEREGLLASEWRNEDLKARGGRPRRYYRLTGYPDHEVGFFSWLKNYIGTFAPQPT